MESTRCRWVTAVGIGRTQCWLQAVSGWYLSLYLLPIPQTPQSTCCKLRFIQLVTLSLFLSLSTVHCYTLPTFAVTNTPSTVSAFVHIGPHHPSVQTSFMDDPPPLAVQWVPPWHVLVVADALCPFSSLDSHMFNNLSPLSITCPVPSGQGLWLLPNYHHCK